MEAEDIYTDPEYIAKLKDIVDAKIWEGFYFFFSAGDAHTDTYYVPPEEITARGTTADDGKTPDPALTQRTYRFCSDIFMKTHRTHFEDVTKKVLEKGYHLMTRVEYDEVPSLEEDLKLRRFEPDFQPGVHEFAIDYVFLNILAHGPTPCGIISAGQYDPNSQILSAVLIEQKPESSQDNMHDLATLVTVQGFRTLFPSSYPPGKLGSLEEQIDAILKRKVLFFDLKNFRILDCA